MVWDVKLLYDPIKDERNRQKHGVALSAAAELFKGPTAVIADARRDYGEARQVAYGFIRQRLFVCVYVDRGETRRIISLRKANKREQHAFDQSYTGES